MGVTVELLLPPPASEGLPSIESVVEVGAAPVRVTVMDLLDAPSVAVTTTFCCDDDAGAVNVLVVGVTLAVNPAVVAPAGTSNDAGTDRAEAKVLDRDTAVPPAGAAVDRMTLHAVEAEAARVVFPHCSDVMEIGAVEALMAKATEALEAPREAVTVTL